MCVNNGLFTVIQVSQDDFKLWISLVIPVVAWRCCTSCAVEATARLRNLNSNYAYSSDADKVQDE
jgi:hypothetical protein